MALLNPGGSLFAPPPENEPAPYPSDMPGSLAFTSPAVAKMMRLMNYREGSGLGVQGQGIVDPIQPNAWPKKTGIGHRKALSLYHDNGLQSSQDAPRASPFDKEWLREQEELSRALRLEQECYETALAALQDMTTLQGDGSAETAHALAAVLASEGVLGDPGRAPGQWKAALPSSALRHVVEKIVIPSIAMGVQGWEPAWDPDCHNWLRRWMPLVGHLPEHFYPAVESKILTRIGELDVYEPWKDYFSPACLAAFAERHVLPDVARLVRALTVTPPKQTDCSFRWAMRRAALVPAKLQRDVVVPMLEEEGGFWDKWERALRHWLRARKPSLGEARAWCDGWRSLFTPELLADGRVLARLEGADGVVESAMRELELRAL
ncbi:septin and tuftelin-interacting protein 1 homolog 1 [Brachypodium distachyon]|uniref:G-patch domain-containing protein n=1 Tax=Brachypodium distachyon TaxID=15368 RepID=I1J290_BRADI|nr:septin and tuftelin-interacting protein 1 homolog 1 [Brachypodium distachyon]KQJ84811.1 hypothetical protein BRADI_5g23010v3 [Brachypodium distachyon]|eukprot:XP_010227296.1 septin and tuftelin-interacting protein 1 homolog 1 [Brachypodium distachyon]